MDFCSLRLTYFRDDLCIAEYQIRIQKRENMDYGFWKFHARRIIGGREKSLRYLKSEAAPVVAFMEVISDAIQADKATRAFGLSQPAGK